MCYVQDRRPHSYVSMAFPSSPQDEWVVGEDTAWPSSREGFSLHTLQMHLSSSSQDLWRSDMLCCTWHTLQLRTQNIYHIMLKCLQKCYHMLVCFNWVNHQTLPLPPHSKVIIIAGRYCVVLCYRPMSQFWYLLFCRPCQFQYTVDPQQHHAWERLPLPCTIQKAGVGLLLRVRDMILFALLVIMLRSHQECREEECVLLGLHW